jgi:hypothetical protein
VSRGCVEEVNRARRRKVARRVPQKKLGSSWEARGERVGPQWGPRGEKQQEQEAPFADPPEVGNSGVCVWEVLGT